MDKRPSESIAVSRTVFHRFSCSRLLPLLDTNHRSPPEVIHFDTGGGKIIAMGGASAPMRVAITDWDKAAKTIRRYTVEALP
jgi:hypothetical protein